MSVAPKRDPVPKIPSPDLTPHSTVEDRREQLAILLGRLLARSWLKQDSAAMSNHLADSAHAVDNESCLASGDD